VVDSTLDRVTVTAGAFVVMQMENALLYTFSTIPQTIGAAFGVLAAFVVYRFQADKGVLAGDLTELIELLDTNSPKPGTGINSARQNAYVLLSNGKDEEFLQLVERSGIPPENSRASLAYRRFASTVRSRPAVNRALFIGFLATSVLILYSLLVLWFEPRIEARTMNCFIDVVLGLGVGGTAICLVLYWRLIRLLLTSP
jgi:hypothetical protein